MHEKSDEVDRIVGEWAKERPDLDLRPLHIFSRITRLAKNLSRAREAAFEKSDLTPWEFDVLAVLRRAGEPYRQSPKVLLHETMVSSGTMTNRIDGMVKRGLVTRSPDPADKRGVLVEITQTGLTLVDVAITRLTDAEETLLADLPQKEREELRDLLRLLTKSVKANSQHVS